MWSRHKHRVWGQDPLHAGRRQRRTAALPKASMPIASPHCSPLSGLSHGPMSGAMSEGDNGKECDGGHPCVACPQQAQPLMCCPPLPSNSCEPQHGGGSGARNMAQCSGVCVRKGQFDSGHMLSITQSPSCGQVGGGFASVCGMGMAVLGGRAAEVRTLPGEAAARQTIQM